VGETGASPAGSQRPYSHFPAAENPLLRLPAVGDNAAKQTDPSKSDLPRRKRRWFQFSLRSLLVLTLICAIWRAYLGRMIEHKGRERKAVQAFVESVDKGQQWKTVSA
jgi:hypothetical protein